MSSITSTIKWNLNAQEIESESFRIIESECSQYASMPPAEWKVARRLIHTTADIDIVKTLEFHNHPIEAGLEALSKRAPIYCDSNMIRAGISIDRLRSVNDQYSKDDIYCYIQDPDIIAKAKASGRTRAISSAEKAKPLLNGSIVLIGNAPLALARIAQYILEENIRPALIIGMPVGFVNVVESKQLLAQTDIPSIILSGRRGGSPLAVTSLHAIIESH